ncbi:hypothetical protein PBI_DEWDROP_21 [Microbacterium phage Dewdrop]|nr:hypothetical protein PBI_LEAF_21 [Microbacterium phage Leaf]QGZ17390.1 hypothetical protein PBI_DEWDROP_21 [Microbacterium phage Dewdrop]
MPIPHYRGGPQVMAPDRRGRISLGLDYALKPYIVETHDDGKITLIPAKPEEKS